MARVKPLSARQAANAKPPKGKDRDTIPDGNRLYLQVSNARNGDVTRSWLFKYQLDGKRHEMGLGSTESVSLKRARERASELGGLLAEGIDPLQRRKAAKAERLAKLAEEAKIVTFKECGERYLKVHSGRWKNAAHIKQWHSTLETYVYPIIGKLNVADITVVHVEKVLEPIWGEIPETASRVQKRIENILDYAKAKQYRSGENPARWRGHLKQLIGPAQKDVEHYAALPFLETQAFMTELRERNSTSGRALEFLVLTAARTNEVLGAQWSEIKGKEWVIPAGRMKGGVEHRCPLSDRAVEILSGMPHHGPYIFANGSRPMSNMALLQLLRGMRPGLTVHGFRSTFRDWAAERTNFPNHVAEKALAHKVADAVEAAYRRGELLAKRRQLMTAWADFCAKPPIEEAADSKVTSIHRKVAADALA
jgi:integrase